MPEGEKNPEIEKQPEDDFDAIPDPEEDDVEDDEDFDDGEPDEEEEDEDEEDEESDDFDDEDEEDDDEPQELIDMTRAHIEQKIEKKAFVKLPSGQGHVCELLMKNGFLIIGGQASQLAEPIVNKDSKAKAYEKAFKKAWEFEAYALAERNLAEGHR